MLYKRLKKQLAKPCITTIPFVVVVHLLSAVILAFTFIAPVPLLSVTVSAAGDNDVDFKRTSNNEINSLQSFYTADAKTSPVDESDLVSGADRTSRGAISRYAKAQTGQPTFYHVINIEFDNARSCENFEVRGAHVFNRFERFADVFIPVNRQAEQTFERIRQASGVVWIETAVKLTAPPPPRARIAPRTKQPPEPIVRGGIQKLTGKGVIIAIVDSGLDFRNQDFITYDSEGNPTSRLLYFWDTTNDAYDSQKLGTKPPLSYPNGASVGTLYTRAQLTAELRSAKTRIPATDLNGHGTAVAGIAAGNANNAPNNKYVKGVAPDADIIAVRIGGSEKPELENAYLINLISGWLDQVAGSQSLVVTCSFGSAEGGHDGQRVMERQLNARFTLNKRGRALVVAAGNEGTNPIHSEVIFNDKHAAGLVRFTGDSQAYINIYFDSGDIKDLYVSAVEGLKKRAWVNPLTKQAVMQIEVPDGDGELRLFNLSGQTMKADAYIFKGKFKPGSVSYNKLITSPGTAANAITSGSFDWNDVFDGIDRKDHCGDLMTVGSLSCYSSLGYARTGDVKPDIAAPGQYYSASYARKPDGSGVNKDETEVDGTGKYRLLNGTSAATPYTAGVIALMMQRSQL